MAYFAQHPETGVTRPEQVAVVGDRLSTDVMMANLMGGYGVWVRDGVQGRGFVSFLFFFFLFDCGKGTNHSSSLLGWRIDCRAFCLEEGIVRLIQVKISLSSLMCGWVDRV